MEERRNMENKSELRAEREHIPDIVGSGRFREIIVDDMEEDITIMELRR